MPRYPVHSGYQARRRARRAAIKTELVPIFQRAEANDERPDIAALAIAFGISTSTIRAIRHELGKEGLIEPPEVARVEKLGQGPVPGLEARIAAVREARLRKWKSPEARNPPPLTEAELDEVLPI